MSQPVSFVLSVLKEKETCKFVASTPVCIQRYAVLTKETSHTQKKGCKFVLSLLLCNSSGLCTTTFCQLLKQQVFFNTPNKLVSHVDFGCIGNP